MRKVSGAVSSESVCVAVINTLYHHHIGLSEIPGLNRAAGRRAHACNKRLPCLRLPSTPNSLHVYSVRPNQQRCGHEEVSNPESLKGIDPQFSGFASQKHTPDTGGEFHGNERLLRCKAGNRDCNLRGVMGFHLQQGIFIKMLSSLRRH